MGELESIEKLVEEYKPRIEAIFGKEIGNVTICPLYQLILDLMLYHDLSREQASEHYEYHKINSHMVTDSKFKRLYVDQKEAMLQVDMNIVHELTHILIHPLTKNISLRKVKIFMQEGFAEYVAIEFPEIRSEKEQILEKERRIQEAYNRPPQYLIGYKFFEEVGNKIGKENILKVFDNPPRAMKEIKKPKKYLKRIAKEESG